MLYPVPEMTSTVLGGTLNLTHYPLLPDVIF